MFIPKSRADEMRLLRRYGNDYLRMPKYMREWFVLSFKERERMLLKHRGVWWALPLDYETSPVSNTGVKMEKKNKTSSCKGDNSKGLSDLPLFGSVKNE